MASDPNEKLLRVPRIAWADRVFVRLGRLSLHLSSAKCFLCSDRFAARGYRRCRRGSAGCFAIPAAPEWKHRLAPWLVAAWRWSNLRLILIKTGTPRAEWNLLYVHILLSLAGVGIIFAEWAGNVAGCAASAVRSSAARFVCWRSLDSALARVMYVSHGGKIKRGLRIPRCRPPL